MELAKSRIEVSWSTKKVEKAIMKERVLLPYIKAVKALGLGGSKFAFDWKRDE